MKSEILIKKSPTKELREILFNLVPVEFHDRIEHQVFQMDERQLRQAIKRNTPKLNG